MEELEVIKRLYNENSKLTYSNKKLIIKYLNEFFFASRMTIKYNNKQYEPIKLVYNNITPKMIVNLNNFRTVYQIFEVFLIKGYQYYQQEQSKNNQTYYLMFEMTSLFTKYCKINNYNFISNNKHNYFEIESFIKAYTLLIDCIENKTWDMFNDILDEIKIKHKKYMLLNELKTINFFNKEYLPYESATITFLIKILNTNEDLVKSNKLIYNYFNNDKDILDMLLSYSIVPDILSRYIILYRIEDNDLSAKEIIKKLKSLSKVKQRQITNALLYIRTIISTSREFLESIDSLDKYFSGYELLLIQNNYNIYKKIQSLRLNLIDIFLLENNLIEAR